MKRTLKLKQGDWDSTHMNNAPNPITTEKPVEVLQAELYNSRNPITTSSYKLERFTRDEAAAYLGCSRSKLYSLERAGLMDGTFYTLGNRRLYIRSRLDRWIMAGGEIAALERKYNIDPNLIPWRA